MPEKYIALTITLFILSMICERLADFIKHSLGEDSNFFVKFIKKLLKIGNTNKKNTQDKDEETKRYFRILKINFFCGFITAIILHADIISIIEHANNAANTDSTLGWDTFSFEILFQKHWYEILGQSVSFFLGCLATGLFISFGSKFWHDLLDLLLYAKNLKQKITDKETYNVENTAQLDEYLSKTNAEIVSAAYLKIKDTIKSKNGVLGIGIGKDKTGAHFVQVAVDETADISDIQTEHYHVLNSLKKIRIPIQIIKNTSPTIQVAPADSISYAGPHAHYGSVSCNVKDNNGNYVLTCFHNLVDAAKANYASTVIKGATVSSPAGSQSGNATLENAIRNRFLDAAIVKCVASERNINFIKGYGAIKGIKNIFEESSDTLIDSQVYMRGAVTKGRFGTITHMYYDAKINYKTHAHELCNLLVVSDNGKALSEPGDSGAPVLDLQGNLLGIVVAGNEAQTFVIPIQPIFEFFKITL